MEYNFTEIEKKWQKIWADKKTFKTNTNPGKPKYYVLDMFPYPSGAGLHVGHPLGYIASDIAARYKRLCGYNVLHPMGYDSFGLPAEQYAIQTGQHPEVTTKQNIARYREQLDKIGFSFDWDREVRTSDPDYYKWTQWIFIQLFNSWYNKAADKAEPIANLISVFEKEGNANVKAACDESVKIFTAADWKGFNEKEKSDVLMQYRIAYHGEAWVNWCPALGTVLANDEVKDGVSERGGYPVERKTMPQWSMRITAYADRLLKGLDTIDWSESIKEAQRNWIGKSEGTSISFKVLPNGEDLGGAIEVFTTRPDTIFGVTYVTLAPEHELVQKITTAENKKAVDEYIAYAKNRSERERQADVKKITGQFTGAYVIHPFTNEKIPVWVGDYVLAGYGTGAVMAVPAHDMRDHAFAKHFSLPIKQVIETPAAWDLQKEAWEEKAGKCINSDFLNGLEVKEAIKNAITEIEKRKLGRGKTNYRLRDAAFGRQRYWGEPIPVYYKNGIPYTVDEKDLPVRLPEVDKFLPTETGEPPLARAKNWKYKGEYEYETTTMPGWAGSSWYYLRYMDAKNDKEFVSKEAVNYWKEIDLYIGGAEHATGHLLYVRFWTKFLKDLGYIAIEEPAKKLINQGMIQGVSQRVREIRIHPSVIESYRENPQELILQIETEDGSIKKDIPVGILPKENHHIYCNHNTKLKFQFLERKSKAKIKTDAFAYTLAKVDFVYEATHNSVVYNCHTLLDGWLKAEPQYRPIVITDFPVLAYWDYTKKMWLNFDDTLCTGLPFWVTEPVVEKMSKSKLNVVSPDSNTYTVPEKYQKDLEYYFDGDYENFSVPGIIEKFGVDCFRLYEMFLGPLEQHKPWNTNGITGVSGFLKKLWKLYHQQSGERRAESVEQRAESGGFNLSEEAATKEELKTLHKTIKKIKEDIERYSFNTSVSNFMICVNELTDLKCNKRSILEPLAIIISPYAPHIAEELWEKLGHKESITYAKFPEFNEEYLTESSFNYPVSFNGKTRFFAELAVTLSKEEVEKEVLAMEDTKKYLAGQSPKKVIVVPKKIVNIVV